MPEYEDFHPQYVKDYDRSKLVLSVKNADITGKELYERLLNQYGLQMEMLSVDYILAMTSVGDTPDGYQRLERALKEIDGQLENAEGTKKLPAALPSVSQRMSIYEAVRQKKTSCALEASEGLPAADYIYLYPPGIPIVTPGEIITDAVVRMIKCWLDDGLHVSGIVRKNGISGVRVIM